MSTLEAIGLPPERLCRNCDPTDLGFADTSTVPDVEGIVGQARAVEAVEFGVAMGHPGYNLFVEGSEGTGRYSAVRRYLEHAAASAEHEQAIGNHQESLFLCVFVHVAFMPPSDS